MWIRKPEHRTDVTYYRQFVKKDNPMVGVWLDSDEHGNIPPEQHQLLQECLEDSELVDKGAGSVTNSYYMPGIIRCVCGEPLELVSAWANECLSCEREYNGFGQLLAPRCFWGEETGEVF